MKRFLITALLTGLFTQVTAPLSPAAKAEQASPRLRHVVLFKWKADTSPEKVREIEQAFAALPTKIKTIVDFEWGTNNSPEGLAQDFTHCFFVTFSDEAGRSAYLPHPAHKAFVELMKPHLDKVLVIDYWAGK